MSTRCHAMVGKRHAPDGPRRCHHDTTRSLFCWQHLKEKEAVRITKGSDGLGVVTTVPRKKDEKFGTVAEFAQTSIRPNATRRGEKLQALKAIRPNTEVTVPAAPAAHAPPPKRKMRLIRPDHGPEPPPLVFAPAPPTPPKKVRTKPARSNADKHEIDLLRRVVALQDLWNDAKLAQSLKIPVATRVINVPARGDRLFNTPLEKLYSKEMDKWIAHANQNPRNAMTRLKLHDIIDKILASQKRKK